MVQNNGSADGFSQNFYESDGGDLKRVTSKKKDAFGRDVAVHSCFKPQKLSSFFFTSFPEKFRAREIYGIFGEYGKADEVIIPGRRDKYGKRFGFVRFC